MKLKWVVKSVLLIIALIVIVIMWMNVHWSAAAIITGLYLQSVIQSWLISYDLDKERELAESMSMFSDRFKGR